MVRTKEDELTLSDGAKVYVKMWKPVESTLPTAHLIFIHGFSDHINAYYNLFPTLSSPPYNIAVYGLDRRGWGRSVTSPSMAGLTGPSTRVLKDIDEFVGYVARDVERQRSAGECAPNSKLFLMGHSMGGQEAFCYMLLPNSSASALSPSISTNFTPQNRHYISSLLLESPYVALDPASQPLGITVFAGKLAARLFPDMQMKQKLSATYMSHDAKVQKDWEDDKLSFDTGTFEGLRGMLARAAGLVKLSEKAAGKENRIEIEADEGVQLVNVLHVPVWCGHGSGDRIVSYDASLKLWKALRVEPDASSATGTSQQQTKAEPNILTGCGGRKVFKTYVNAYHKLHTEPDGVGDQFAKDVGDWILEHAGSSTSPSASSKVKNIQAEAATGTTSAPDPELSSAGGDDGTSHKAKL